MQLTWKDYLRLYGPFAAYALVLIVGAIYSLGYRNGMCSLLDVSGRAVQEARQCGV
jgi:hypothetical protein